MVKLDLITLERIKTDLAGPTGHLIKSYLTKLCESKTAAALSVPQNRFDELNREQILGQAALTRDLFSNLSSHVDTLIREERDKQ
jgi:hypothetical protein